jgi:hypothetical protein
MDYAFHARRVKRERWGLSKGSIPLSFAEKRLASPEARLKQK